MTTAAPYTPRSGLRGRVQRQLARRMNITPLRIAPERPLVTFSFDDFPKSAGETGAAILEAFGWRGVYYASAGLMGTTNHHGPQFEIADLHRLADAGHEIACHSHDHLDAARAGADAIADNAARNRAALAEAGFEPTLEHFAFPYGEATPGAKTRLLETYRCLRGVQPGINRGVADRGLLKSTPLYGGEAGLAHALAMVQSLRHEPGWLIFFGHDIETQPTDWGCTPAFLHTVAEAVARSGAEVVTLSQALDRLEGAA